MLQSMPPDVDKPLEFAMNYMQAFSVALHILKRYLAHAELPGGFIHGLMLNVLIWDQYPPTIDETPQYASNIMDGTTPIEHYVREVQFCCDTKNIGITKNQDTSFPLHDTSVSAREEAEEILRAAYIAAIVEVMKLISRAPIVSINHDLRFIQNASQLLCHRGVLNGLEAIGGYLALELRIPGCVVVQGSSFWRKLVSSLTDNESGTLMQPKQWKIETHICITSRRLPCTRNTSFARR
ncbi:hypothetical protein AK812_SmicGene37198 [Symbiodinium microadriaticum]|uniref:Uncharacterized protein n=1 Tax=Symbiodinium microadriaticum TaxID=2951 RepID=A0A1Q9CGU3_SYMMI|nr:hypothetical protein AK812_SmicGene37198 [Symbiodinium microadriaticum]